MIPALALTAGMTVSPTLAQASTCDDTFVTVAVTDAAGRIPPGPPQGSVLDSRDPGRQVTLSLGSPYHYLTRNGVIRPAGFLRDLLQRRLLQLGVGEQPLERRVLPFEILQPLRVVGLQPAELVAPAVRRALRMEITIEAVTADTEPIH
jgi:hypothetical protein